jgi:hypothetical protein
MKNKYHGETISTIIILQTPQQRAPTASRLRDLGSLILQVIRSRLGYRYLGGFSYDCSILEDHGLGWKKTVSCLDTKLLVRSELRLP